MKAVKQGTIKIQHMGQDHCKGTKGWTFNKKSILKKKFYPHKIKRRPQTKKPVALQSLCKEKTAKIVWVALNN